MARYAALLPARHMKEELKVLAIGIAAFAVYLPTALWVSKDFVLYPEPPGRVVEAVQGMSREKGNLYRSRMSKLHRYADASEDNMRSPVILYENLTPLGPARSYLRDIQDTGLGRFSFVHFGEDTRSFLVFSTSDNTDPSTNGRRYWLVLP